MTPSERAKRHAEEEGDNGNAEISFLAGWNARDVEVLRLTMALERCKEQRDSCMGDYSLNHVELIWKRKDAYEAELDKILEGGGE